MDDQISVRIDIPVALLLDAGPSGCASSDALALSVGQAALKEARKLVAASADRLVMTAEAFDAKRPEET
jgi:hypothetical protein